ncbi:MAG: cytochrome-c peroxidase [Pseudomonadales bacterium]
MIARALMILIAAGAAVVALAADHRAEQLPLGLPPVPIPEDNGQTIIKVQLGDKLFHDTRFSSTGDVSCATCHDRGKAFTDSPLKTSEGINKLTGTRNAPTAANAAYNATQFWDGRSPSLEDQSIHPFVNPLEMGLADHEPILELVRNDREYRSLFNRAFRVRGKDIAIEHVTKAIAAFERTLLFGNSDFDRYYFAGENDALSAPAQRGFDLFLNKGRCVSCHSIEQDHALFTDHRFHNVGVGINQVQADVPEMTSAYLSARSKGAEVDLMVLSDPKASELGRFAVTTSINEIGAFKTPTLRNIEVTGPYMHDGSIATLREVVEHYNNGGKTAETDQENAFLSGGIRPLNLTEAEIDELVAFMEALTSPEYQAADKKDAS